METAIILLAILVGVLVVRHTIRGKSKSEILFSLLINGVKINSKVMAVTITTTQQFTGALTPADRLKNPAPVEAGSVTITSSDESIATVERNPENEIEFTVKGKKAGVVSIDFSADADLGEGITTITGFIGVEVLPAQATGFGITLGDVVEQQ